MFDRGRYLEAILSQSKGEDWLSGLVLSAELVYASKNKSEQKKIINVLDGLREYAKRHILLLGKPGSGKSTALKQLRWEEAEQCLCDVEHHIPVLIELRRQEEINTLIAKALSVPRYRLTADDIPNLLDTQKFLLLFDGLNELPSGTHGMDDWREEFSDVPMIFTSRELGTESYPRIDSRLQMQPLSNAQTHAFLIKKLGAESAVKLIQALDYRLKELTDNPMLLNMLCSVYQKNDSIPRNRGRLFRQFTRNQYEEYKSRMDIKPHSDLFFYFRDEMLQELAFFMMDADGEDTTLWLQVEHCKAAQWLEKRFGHRDVPNASVEVKKWLDDALKFHLSLQCTADKTKIEFLHQLFQEYYAAEWLKLKLNQCTEEQLICHIINNAKWYESLKILSDLLESREQKRKLASAIHRLIDSLDDESVQFIGIWEILFSILINLPCDVTENYVNDLIKNKPILEKKPFADFDKLYRAISRYKKQLNNIVILLWIWSDKTIIRTLVLLSGLSSDIDFLIISRMGILVTADSNHIPILLEIVENNKIHSLFRQAATIALGNFHKNESEDALIGLLNSYDYNVRCLAAQSLGNIKSTKAINTLLNIIRIGHTQEIEYGSYEYSPFCYGGFYIYEYAAIALAAIEVDSFVSQLAFELEACEDQRRKISYIRSLGKMKSCKALPYLVNQLQDIHTQIQEAAISSIGSLGFEDAIPFITDLIKENIIILNANKNSDWFTHEGVAFGITLNKINLAINALSNIACINIPNNEAIILLVSFVRDEAYSKHNNIKNNLLDSLRKIPHYLSLEAWLDEMKHSQPYIEDKYKNFSISLVSEQSPLICKFTSETDKQRFNSVLNAIDGFEKETKYIISTFSQSSNGNRSYASIETVYGSYSKEWFEKSKIISKCSSTKEANISGITNNFTEICPLILTEGKTDWKHLEFALKKLQAQGEFSSLKIEFSKAEEHMGYAQMLQHCQALSKSPQNRLHICIFDRDEEKVNSEFKVKNNSDKAFVYYGNSVFVTRIPQLIVTEDKISIENYYSNHDLERTDSQGRRLPRSGFKVINNKQPEDLSKNDFADNIRKEIHEFKNVDVSKFAKIFELIETIIAEAKEPR